MIKNISSTYGLPDYVVEEIWLSQFRFVRDKIKEGEYKTIMLHKWGKYTPSLRKLEHIKKHVNKEADSGTV